MAATVWKVSGSVEREYSGEARGTMTDKDGASVVLRSAVRAPTGIGVATVTLSADPYRHHRVRVVGEVKTHSVTGGASIWLREDGPNRFSLLDNGQDRPIRGDSGWTESVAELPVTRDATSLVFGALLSGTGELDVRNLRLEVLAPPGRGALSKW